MLRPESSGQRQKRLDTCSGYRFEPQRRTIHRRSWPLGTGQNHGLQFKAAHLQITAPSSLVGIEKYLGSGMVKGIGTHFAKKLIVAFGKAVFNVIEQEPERLLALPGIGEKRKRQLLASWQEQKVIRSIMVFLQGHGISSTRAVRIYKTYGDEAVAR